MATYENSKLAKTVARRIADGDAVYISAFKKAIDYFTIYDHLEHTSHLPKLIGIFGEDSACRKPLSGISLESSCSSRTIYRYQQKYVDCIMMFVRSMT